GRMRWALYGKDRFRERAAAAVPDLQRQARENAAIAAQLLQQEAAAADPGADTRTLIGRLVMAQVAGSENLIGRMQLCCQALGLPSEGVRPLPMADSLVAKANEVV